MESTKNIDEIRNVLERHDYPIESIIHDILMKFKTKSLIYKSGISKKSGFSSSEIITLLMLLPLMTLGSVHAIYRSQYSKLANMKKDTIYRLKNDESIAWRTLLYGIAKKFSSLVNKDKTIAENSAFIIDDTTDTRVGYKIEGISVIHNHVSGKSKYSFGFKNLVLAFFDGKTTIPLDFSLHSEKKLCTKQLKQQYEKDRNEKSSGGKRKKETKTDKITNGLTMLKRSVKHGFIAKYVLADSWFSSEKFITTIRKIKDGAMHVICGIKKDARYYIHEGEKQNAKQLIQKLTKRGKVKKCRKWNTRYMEVLVTYAGVGDVKLYICRFPYQKDWRVFMSTDTSLSFVAMMEIYSIRWTIEVMFRELKQHLQLGRCQSRDFDAQIASVTISLILYTLLAYCRRINAYETIGGLFKLINTDICEKTVAQRIWELFDELLSVVIEQISDSGAVDITSFKNSREYKNLKELFESSFLGNQLDNLEKSA